MTPKQIQKATIAELARRGVEVPASINLVDLVPYVERLTGVHKHFTNTHSGYLEAFLKPAQASGKYVPKFRPLSLAKTWGESMVRANQWQPPFSGMK